ncbi:ATPase, T2SS/T4P/T4SS family [Pararhizobium sp. BT-229]|uniref:ATPase, T2SS/T4P/T4SS family n=1 Tax=Pararhizobium sp. BT-229 TaxID=2986923 RepID=UPI0021F799E4|nr:ATPase, T2SS/T4P/T4SS family [Pararhizobium sp. BT-229]MCV9964148.1 ATPase, T2SS/T4P/T4SS family [Pararhizobium sp. BT-229]
MDTDDQKLLADYLMNHAHGDQRIADLLWHSVGRVMLKDRRKVVQLHVAMEEADMVYHIVDWLKVAVAENARWLGKTDEHGRPKKLLKFGTLEAINAEADRWMRRRQASQEAALAEGDEEMHFDLGDGWSMVRLLTPAALDRESTIMQHCIGHGSYDERLSEEGTLFLSLRDPYGMPHVTLEIDGDYLVQFQGKQNTRPIAKYVIRCLPYFRANRLSNLPDDVVTDTHGMVHAIYDLPDVLTVDGAIRINNTSDHLRLPKVIEATGSVTLSGRAFANVPTRIRTGGSLNIHESALARLPETVDVGRDISLENSIISELPKGLTVEGELSIRSSAIRRLPRRLTVRGLLDIGRTAVDHLPEDLRCGNINISHTKIKRFDTSVFLFDEDPNKNRYLGAASSGLLEIVGKPHFRRLDLTGAMITALPEGLEVTENLDISSSAISEITREMKVGSLTASQCQLRIDLERIDGPVKLTNSSVSMCEEFSCGSTVYLNGATVRNARIIKAEVITFANGPIPTTLVAHSVDFQSRTERRIDCDVIAGSIVVRPDVEFLGEGVSAETVRVGWGATAISIAEARELLLKEGSLRSCMKDGINIISGPIGSGKSSALLAALSRMSRANDRNYITIENPPEYVFPNMRIVRPRVAGGRYRGLPLDAEDRDIRAAGNTEAR